MYKKRKGYIKKQAATALDLKPSQIQFYTDVGIVKPEINAPKGRGTRRVYSKRNLFEILIVKQLVDHGVPLKNAKGILKGLESWAKQLQIPEREFPKDFPSEKKNRMRERARIADMLWHPESWDFEYDVFLGVHDRSKERSVISVFSIRKKDQRPLQIDEGLDRGTVSFLVINITDLIERVARL